MLLAIIPGMDTTHIIQEIDSEIARLEYAKLLLGGHKPAKRGRKPSKATSFAFGTNATTAKLRKRRTISAEGRARIAAAQKARWAKTKRT